LKGGCETENILHKIHRAYFTTMYAWSSTNNTDRFEREIGRQVFVFASSEFPVFSWHSEAGIGDLRLANRRIVIRFPTGAGEFFFLLQNV
jgi:hypothetical protein